MRKIIPLLIILMGFQTGLLADWKTEISGYFNKKNDYRGAADYLLNSFETVNEKDKAIVCGLLAFSFSMLNDKNNEYKWLGEYFETYGGYGTGFNFLDVTTNAAILDYIKIWKGKYPLVTEIGLIDKDSSYNSASPAILIIGIEIMNNAHYKLSDEKNILEGGLFMKGFNSLSIKSGDIFEGSGSHFYFLDLKADDFSLRKEIEIDIKMDTFRKEKKPENKVMNREYLISMYIGDKLVASARKSAQTSIPLKIDIPLGKGRFAPYGPVDPHDRPDPFSSSFSIFNAVAGIYNLAKELKKGKEREKLTPSIQPKRQITVTFVKKISEGADKRVSAIITLKKKNVKFFPLHF
ncbi:MAG: hypothetical protein ACETWK_06230 [Candidatus Aminicenantaceae bacterium]